MRQHHGSLKGGWPWPYSQSTAASWILLIVLCIFLLMGFPVVTCNSQEEQHNAIISSCQAAFHDDDDDEHGNDEPIVVDCYPYDKNRPYHLTEEHCLAQGCCWNATATTTSSPPLCRFPKKRARRVASASAAASSASCRAVRPALRLACRNPHDFAKAMSNQETCEAMGCCFDVTSTTTENKKNVEIPCFQPRHPGAYHLSAPMRRTTLGWIGTIILDDPEQAHNNSLLFGNHVRKLQVHILEETLDSVRIRIEDPSIKRYDAIDFMPHPSTPNDHQRKHKNQNPRRPAYQIQYTVIPFGIAIVQLSTGHVVFNSTPSVGSDDDDGFYDLGGLVFSNQYLEWSTRIVGDVGNNNGNNNNKNGTSFQSPRLYGLGERVGSLRLPVPENDDDGQQQQQQQQQPLIYTLNARDRPPQDARPQDHSRTGGNNLYGHHPFIMQVTADGSSHGVYVRSSVAMDVVLTSRTITWRMVGGIWDVTILMGPTPAAVVEQYSLIIGRPMMPPYWALGYHLCRWGYGSAQETHRMVQRMRAANIPQEAQWNDIDYMDQHAIFTLDPESYSAADMRAMVDDLHNHHQYYVNIYDPGIAKDYQPAQQKNGNDVVADYTPRTRALALGTIIRTANGTEPLVGRVWPGWVYFPDFHHPRIQEFWGQEIAAFHRILGFDGMWLDMNEPSNFCDGERPYGCGGEADVQKKQPDAASLTASFENRTYDKIPFVPYPFDPYRQPYVPGQLRKEPHLLEGYLDARTVTMSARQAPTLHYFLHSLYGLEELRQSYTALQKVGPNRRPFLLTRSTAPGSGMFGFHWLGDNESTWQHLRDSIAGILTMNLLGIALVGPDICGFAGEATEELCIRWHHVAAFYPFARNHNDLGKTSQAPVDFSPLAQDHIRDALHMRYRLLPHLYTLCFLAHRSGAMIVKPLFVDFAADEVAKDIDEQFLFGSALLITPVLYPGRDYVEGYFPPGCWYDFQTGQALSSTTGVWRNISAPLNHVPVHLREGWIVTMQEPAMTTYKARQTPFTLVAALPQNKSSVAKGEWYWDDGISMDAINTQHFVRMEYMAGGLQADTFWLAAAAANGQGTKPNYDPILSTIIVYGMPPWSASRSWKVWHDGERKEEVPDVLYNTTTHTITFFNLSVPMQRSFILRAVPEASEATWRH